MPANNEAILTTTPAQAAAMLDLLLNTKQPVMIWGDPGIGKSDLVGQAAAARGMDLIDLRLSLLSDVDLRGIPRVENGLTEWAPPSFLPRTSKPTILFFDEMNRGMVSVMNSAFQLILGGKLGEYTLPENVRIIAACNYDGAGVNPVSPALRNRFSRIDLVANVADWLKWAAANGINPMVQAFIRFRPDLLNAYDPKAPAFPTPRAWQFVSKILSGNPSDAIRLNLYAGTVGQAAAIEFLAFEKAWKELPNIAGILLNPAGAPVPTGVATVYAVANALANECKSSNINAVMTYLERLPVEYQVFAVSSYVKRDANLCNTARFITWASKHADLL